MTGPKPIILHAFLLLGFSLLPMHAQLISVSSELSTDSLMIGDQIIYTLSVDADDQVDFNMPVLRDTLTRQLELLSLPASDTTHAEGRRTVSHSYLLTSFEAGMQIVPAQEVIYASGNLKDTARSMPLMIQVYEPVVDTTQAIKPIKPPLNTPLSFREVLPWLAVGLGGLLVVILGGMLLRRYLQRKRHPEEYEVRDLEPAHIVAFRELDKLKAEKIWEKGEVKQFYTSLTEITRTYIERQYGIPAMESTTEEILQAFRRSSPEDSLLDEILQELLQLADLVKFAKEDPLPVHNQTNLNNAYIFVQKTYPQFYREEVKNEQD
jgi:hypothetical protein